MNLVTASQKTSDRLASVTGLVESDCRPLSAIRQIDEYSNGSWAVLLDCPVCELGYVADEVCRECFGAGDVFTDDLEEIARLLDLWS